MVRMLAGALAGDHVLPGATDILRSVGDRQSGECSLASGSVAYAYRSRRTILAPPRRARAAGAAPITGHASSY